MHPSFHDGPAEFYVPFYLVFRSLLDPIIASDKFLSSSLVILAGSRRGLRNTLRSAHI